MIVNADLLNELVLTPVKSNGKTQKIKTYVIFMLIKCDRSRRNIDERAIASSSKLM
ncbi:hypothetical protein [Nostoc sp.]|uniref:hypothetical protein n=1 Tax=Nostoc sp. TaxID=1180 RepID=UPI002FF51A09